MKRSIILVIGIAFLLLIFSACTTSHNAAVDTKAQEEGGDTYNKWLGEKLFNDGEYEKAFEILSRLAEQGNARDQYYIGWMYDNGQGIPQDHKKAAEW